jgi:type I restriction-modification system DNA methylase subunit
MDTDDLSIPTYSGIIIESEKFNHDLTLQFGVLASVCKDDDDYLNQAEAIIKGWLKEDDFEDIIDSIFFGEPVNEQEFRKTLLKMLSKITEIRKTPMNEREYEDRG